MWDKGLLFIVRYIRVKFRMMRCKQRLFAFTLGCKVRLKSGYVLLNQECVCEGLCKIPSNFSLHLIKVAKLKQFKKVSSNLKTILVSNLADLWFLELWERRTTSISLNYVVWKNSLKLTWSKKELVVCEALFYLK